VKIFALLDHPYPTPHTLLVADLDPTIKVLGRKVFPAAGFVEQMHDHFALGRVRLAIIGIALSAAVFDLAHLLLEQIIRDQPLTVRFEELLHFKICGRHITLLSQ
jgi:hypothetical protein